MRVVAASVCNGDGFSGRVGGSAHRRVWKAGVLLDGKCVHVSPREHRSPFTVAKDADNAGLANPFVYIVTQLVEFRCDERCRFRFLKTELGMGMKLFVHIFLPARSCKKVGEQM
jgi:hypothetical protein